MDTEYMLSYLFDILRGDIKMNERFKKGKDINFAYDFKHPKLIELKEKYHLNLIAQGNTTFEKAIRIMHFLAPNLEHNGDYQNQILCNSLDLMNYSFKKGEKYGINCLSKSKILEECLLSIGIFARRVSIMPYSPYDRDNHVICEYYDNEMCKWVMLDPSSDRYYLNSKNIPLGILEIRKLLANRKTIKTVCLSSVDNLDINKIVPLENDSDIYYLAKNFVWFVVSDVHSFGIDNLTYYTLEPVHMNTKDYLHYNGIYRKNVKTSNTKYTKRENINVNCFVKAPE